MGYNSFIVLFSRHMFNTVSSINNFSTIEVMEFNLTTTTCKRNSKPPSKKKKNINAMNVLQNILRNII